MRQTAVLLVAFSTAWLELMIFQSAGRFVVPELLQHDATPEKLAAATLKLISNRAMMDEIRAELMRIHESLQQNTEEKAAQAILAYL